MADLKPLGDRAFLAQFASEREAARWAAAVRAVMLAGVTDVVLAYRSAAVFADPDLVDLEALEARLGRLEPGAEALPPGRLIDIPVLYDGPDLELVAAKLCLEPKAVIARHADAVYDVFAIGFVQGFPYAGYLPRELCGLPRRDEPRLRVPAGAVAIAGRQTGVYPRESPGGWHLLGRTPVRIADQERGVFPIRAGDRIRFHPIDHKEFEARRDESLQPSG